MLIILLALSTSCWTNAQVSDLNPLSDEFIDNINGAQNSWIAGKNFPSDTPLEHLLTISNGAKVLVDYEILPKKIHDPELIARLPDEFDARKKWTFCPSLNEIRDQGSCGSCWAFGSVEAMTDRTCIYSKGKVKKHLSTEEVLCCAELPPEDHGNGCLGNDQLESYRFWIKNGIVTGGGFGSNQGCQPYTFSDFLLSSKEIKTPEGDSPPPCEHKCRPGYKVPFDKDKSFGKDVKHVKGEKNMMAEIYEHGPISADFMVYEDFMTYTGGVYKRSPQSVFQGNHTVKVLGWGKENGSKYWFVANSWSNNWGINGYFKILRGVNECDFEARVLAGTPRL